MHIYIIIRLRPSNAYANHVDLGCVLAVNVGEKSLSSREKKIYIISLPFGMAGSRFVVEFVEKVFRPKI